MDYPPYFIEFMNVLIIHLTGLISPGPNFALVVRNSLLFSRRHAFYTIGGLTIATSLQIFIVLVGLGLIICNSPNTLKVIQVLGALFLAYLGLNGWGIHFFESKTSKNKASSPAPDKEEAHPGHPTVQKTIRLAFMTSLLNPMSLLFYVAVFTNEVASTTPFSIRFFYFLVMVATYALWFITVALFFSQKRLQDKFMKAKTQLDRIIGTILLAFAVKFILAVF